MENKTLQKLYEKFEFRNILPEEAEQAAEVEAICFPPNEACTEESMKRDCHRRDLFPGRIFYRGKLA